MHAQSCLTLSNPMDCSPPGFSVQGILQERILSGLPFPLPGNRPNPSMEFRSPESPALAGGFSIPEPLGKQFVGWAFLGLQSWKTASQVAEKTVPRRTG